jgi:2-oxoglutarate dehydrogenase E1 component
MSDLPNSNYFTSFGPNAGFIAELYQLFREDPALVSPEWEKFFSAGQHNASNGTASHNGHHPAPATLQRSTDSANGVPSDYLKEYQAQLAAERAISAFRNWGHLNAKLSPIVAGGIAPEPIKELKFASYLPEEHGSPLQLRSAIAIGGRSITSVNELLNLLSSIYCGSVGYEFEHIPSIEERDWLRERIEGARQPHNAFSADARREFLKILVRTGVLESELHRKYVGSKWFSVDGNDSLMPAIKHILDLSTDFGVNEAIFGMAHRGRINVLVNSLGMPLERLFAEFEDRSVATVVGAGDVKYHLGWQSEHEHNGSRIKLELLANPSHLEFVNAVVEGVARAKQDLVYGRNRSKVLPVLLHGDAAFAGQGIVFECINYAGLDGYTTGGSLHIVINNQIGFTTTPDEGRSSRYCSDLAKGLGIPVFHVNAEDPDATCWVAELALQYRHTFGKDVIIDIIGHRKYGHNESDDPSFTQPLTYQELKGKTPIWQQYGER